MEQIHILTIKPFTFGEKNLLKKKLDKYLGNIIIEKETIN